MKYIDLGGRERESVFIQTPSHVTDHGIYWLRRERGSQVLFRPPIITDLGIYWLWWEPVFIQTPHVIAHGMYWLRRETEGASLYSDPPIVTDLGIYWLRRERERASFYSDNTYANDWHIQYKYVNIMMPWYNWNIVESGLKHHNPSFFLYFFLGSDYLYLTPPPPSPS